MLVVDVVELVVVVVVVVREVDVVVEVVGLILVVEVGLTEVVTVASRTWGFSLRTTLWPLERPIARTSGCVPKFMEAFCPG
jgi:hypothetical protein